MTDDELVVQLKQFIPANFYNSGDMIAELRSRLSRYADLREAIDSIYKNHNDGRECFCPTCRAYNDWRNKKR